MLIMKISILKIVTFSVTFILIKASNDDRLDCYLENSFTVDKKSCEDRECIWDPILEPKGAPKCYLDVKKVGYKALNSVKKSATGIEVELQLKETAKKTTKTFGQIENLKLEVSYLTDRILRFKIFDPKNKRYEVPFQENFPLLQTSPQEKDENNRKYSVDLSYEESKDNFQFSISRKDTKTKVFDTSIGGLMFSDQFIQIATYLPSKNIYGFGENIHQTLRHDLNYKTWPLFGNGELEGEPDKNLYGVHPFYTCLENNGKSHGVLLLNSNAMEYSLLPHPALSLKTLGGILDFFVFIGDNPEHVIQLYTSLIGRPVMPPFWGLGFQLCRWGFNGTKNLQEVIDRNIKAKVPLDVMYLDIDYMIDYHDWTYDHKNYANLPQLISDNKRDHKLHWTLIVDPAIEANETIDQVFPDGYKQEVFIKWPKSVPMAERHNPPNVPTDKDVIYGKVWPRGPAAFPDFFKNATKNWWKKWMNHLHKDLKFDGIWIDMNEPWSFAYNCPNTKYDFPDARTKSVWLNGDKNQLSLKTLCMTTLQGENNEYMHYDVHSLYGLSETLATVPAIQEITGKRGLVLSRSNYVSSGRYAAHWLGDNHSEWPHMRNSIIGILEFNLFGISYVGADICGFEYDTNPELCRRWQQLGAFYPFSRNHNTVAATDQDPGVWISRGHSEVTEAARESLLTRYWLLPYLYTLFYRANTLGETVARPVFHEFPLDNNTHGIDQQFMWGRSVLISPFLYENQTQVDAYLPDDIWFDISYGFERIHQTGHVKLDESPLGPPLQLRGSSIIPVFNTRKHVSTETLRNESIALVVLPGKTKTAFGDLFWDDGDSINTIETGKYNYYTFKLLSNCTLEIDVIKSGYDNGLNPQIIDVIFIADTVEGDIEAYIDGNLLWDHVESALLNRNSSGTSLKANINLLSKKSGEKFTINWKLSKTNSCNIK